MLYDRTIGNFLHILNISFFAYWTVWVVVTPFVDSSHFTQILFPPREYGLAIPAFIMSVIVVVLFSAASYHIIRETGQREKIAAVKAAIRVTQQQNAASTSGPLTSFSSGLFTPPPIFAVTGTSSGEAGEGSSSLVGQPARAGPGLKGVAPKSNTKKASSQARSGSGDHQTDGHGGSIQGDASLGPSSSLLPAPRLLRGTDPSKAGDDDDIVVDRSQLLGTQFNMNAVKTGGLYGGSSGMPLSPTSQATGAAAAAMSRRDVASSGVGSGSDENDSTGGSSVPQSGGAAAAAGGFHSRGNSYS